MMYIHNPEPTSDQRALVKQLKALPEFSQLKARQRIFLLAFIATGSIYRGAEKVSMHWMNHYNWIKHDLYLKAYEKAQEMYADFAEGDVMERAFEGELHEIKKNGQLIESYKRKSDILAMFALKKMRPAYRDNPQLAVQVNNAPPVINFQIIAPTEVEKSSKTIDAKDENIISISQIQDTISKDK